MRSSRTTEDLQRTDRLDGTPLMAVGLWKREEIDRIEASLYRKIMRIGNDIPNTVILNTMTNIRLLSEVIQYLSKEHA